MSRKQLENIGIWMAVGPIRHPSSRRGCIGASNGGSTALKLEGKPEIHVNKPRCRHAFGLGPWTLRIPVWWTIRFRADVTAAAAAATIWRAVCQHREAWKWLRWMWKGPHQRIEGECLWMNYSNHHCGKSESAERGKGKEYCDG